MLRQFVQIFFFDHYPSSVKRGRPPIWMYLKARSLQKNDTNVIFLNTGAHKMGPSASRPPAVHQAVGDKIQDREERHYGKDPARL